MNGRFEDLRKIWAHIFAQEITEEELKVLGLTSASDEATATGFLSDGRRGELVDINRIQHFIKLGNLLNRGFDKPNTGLFHSFDILNILKQEEAYLKAEKPKMAANTALLQPPPNVSHANKTIKMNFITAGLAVCGATASLSAAMTGALAVGVVIGLAVSAFICSLVAIACLGTILRTRTMTSKASSQGKVADYEGARDLQPYESEERQAFWRQVKAIHQKLRPAIQYIEASEAFDANMRQLAGKTGPVVLHGQTPYVQ